jgi:hypothetical protein
MKTLTSKLAALSLTVLISTTSFSLFADGNEMETNSAESYFEEYFDFQSFNQELEMNLAPEMNVRIYDMNGDLMMAGNEDSDRIKNLTRTADLMTEVNGTKMYRISY